MRGARPLLLPAALFLLPLVAVPWLRDAPRAFPVWIALLVPSTAGWLLAWRRAGRAAAAGPGGIAVVIGAGALARLLWLAPPVPLSDDLYRYLWDGRVANAGIHPFAYAPSSPRLAPLRDDAVWPRINHPDIPTIYPPVAQVWFRMLDALAPSPRGVRGAAVLADLAAVAFLALLLRVRGRPPALAVVAAWCPLSVLESAGGGHVDALGAALFLAALAARERVGESLLSGFLVGLSALVKPVPALAVPALLRPGPWRRRIALLVGAALGLTVAVPYLGAGAKLFTGFLAYAEHWRFNDSLYWLLIRRGLSPDGAREVLAAAVAALSLIAVIRLRDPLAAAGCAVAAGIALSPTVHPWYALWLVPFLVFLPRSVAPAALVLVALLPLSYAAAWAKEVTGTWVEPGWLRPAVWLPTAAALLVAPLVAFRHRPPDGS